MNAIVGTILAKAVLIGLFAAVCYIAVIVMLNIRLMAVGQKGYFHQRKLDKAVLRDLIGAAKLSTGDNRTTHVARAVYRSVNGQPRR